MPTHWNDTTNPALCALAHEPLRTQLTEQNHDLHDHEARLRALEKMAWRSAGLSAAAAALGGLLAQLAGLIK
jgi:hypothetical protein